MDQKKHGEKISEAEFEKMLNAYESQNPGKTKSVLLDADMVAKIATAPGATGVRIYFGLDAEGRLTVMLKSEGNDITALKDGGAGALNRGQLCPPYCPDK
jgi:hypothetical protein